MPQVNWGRKPVERRTAAPAIDIDKLVLGQKPLLTRRLNVNIPAALHGRIKVQCAIDGKDMTEVLIAMLEARFPERR